MDRLTIIFVTFNSFAAIRGCLPGLAAAARWRILVVDNNSQDGTAARIRTEFPGVEVVEQAINIGYGRAANVGLRATETPYALLLNPDLRLTAEDVERLLDHVRSDSSETAIWAPATSPGDVSSDPPRPVEWVSGSAMLFDVEKVRQVGLFDENIFLFSEETDLCERVVRAGYGIKLCPDVFFDHLVGQSSPFNEKIEYMKWWHFGWSQCYRMTKNGHCRRLRNPRRKELTYRLHSLIATSRAKRLKWKAKADGARAFIQGNKAFRADGTPQMS